MTKVRAIRKDYGLPQSLWELFIVIAAYLHNRSLLSPLGGITLYKKYYGEKPDLKYLRIPSCKAYHYIPKQRQDGKLGDRGKLYYFVGYTHSQTIYRLYDPTARRTFILRDVIFDEGPAVTA